MTKERKELFVDVLKNDLEFAKQIIPKGIDEMVKAFAEKGYDFTKEEVEEMGILFKEVATKCIKDDGEIDEEMLDQVAGGCKTCVMGIIGIILLGIAAAY